jgi:hypothetical protein
MRIQMKDAVLLMENSKSSNRCIAIHLSADILLKSMDQEFVRSTLDKTNRQRMWSSIKVSVPALSLYFAKTDDLEREGVVQAEKRDILQPMGLCYEADSWLTYEFPEEVFESKVTTKITCDDLLMKLSIEDVYTLSTVSQKQQDDLQKLLGVWNEHNSKNRPKAEPKVAVAEQKQLDVSSMEVKARDFEVVIINEKDGGYVPMFFTKVDRIAFTQETDSHSELSGMYAQVYFKLDYFNPNSGCYEPVIETVPLMYKFKKVKNSSDTTFYVAEPISINVSCELGANLAMFQKLWGESTELAEKMRKRAEEAQKAGDGFRVKPTLERGRNMTFKQAGDRKTMISHKTFGRKMLVREKENTFASPYALRNLTFEPIQVQNVDKNGVLIFETLKEGGQDAVETVV